MQICTAVINYRLPNNTKPVTYDVTLATDVHKGDFNFTGTVIIELEVIEKDTNEIILHTKNLTIDAINLFANNNVIENHSINTTYKYENTTNFLIITTTETLVEKLFYRLEIKYHGELASDGSGFFRSSYVDAKGEKKQV